MSDVATDEDSTLNNMLCVDFNKILFFGVLLHEYHLKNKINEN